MKRTMQMVTVLVIALMALATVAAFADVIPATNLDVVLSETSNTITWTITNLTDSSHGFVLDQVDWLFPTGDVANVAPTSGWKFTTYSSVIDPVSGTLTSDSVSWKATSLSKGLTEGQSLSFTIQTVLPTTPADETQLFPISVQWDRSLATAKQYDSKTTSINTGVVPEPSSLLALMCGIGGIGGLLWKRKSI